MRDAEGPSSVQALGLLTPRPLPELPAFTVTLTTGTKAIVTVVPLGCQSIARGRMAQIWRFHNSMCELTAVKPKGGPAAPTPASPAAKKLKQGQEDNAAAPATAAPRVEAGPAAQARKRQQDSAAAPAVADSPTAASPAAKRQKTGQEEGAAVGAARQPAVERQDGASDEVAQ